MLKLLAGCIIYCSRLFFIYCSGRSIPLLRKYLSPQKSQNVNLRVRVFDRGLAAGLDWFKNDVRHAVHSTNSNSSVLLLTSFYSLDLLK